MSSRYAAARPKREGEAFARSHHGEREEEDDGPSSKKVRFDVRNPSALVPDAREEDEVLDADVIGVGSGAGTKRGAVNIDGYDSDSDNETFKTRGGTAGGGKSSSSTNYVEQMDNYGSKGGKANGAGRAADEDDDEVDMFAGADEDEDENKDKSAGGKDGKADKRVRFLEDRDIEGQEQSSRSGGHVRLDDEGSSEDEEEILLGIEEEGVDEEVGAGGLKRNAPKIDAFNMKEEQEEGAFDEAGNFVRKAVDPDAVHDKWLLGISKKDMKKAAAAQEKRDADARQQRREDDSLATAELLSTLIQHLHKAETVLEALARLGKAKTKDKKVPKWKQKKQHKKSGPEDMDADVERPADDPEQERIKAAIDNITEAADRLLGRDYSDIYDTEREKLLREYRSEAGQDWVEPTKPADGTRLWEYRWIDGRDGENTQGPFDGQAMKAWQDAGYFGDSVEFRLAGQDGEWTRVASFV